MCVFAVTQLLAETDRQTDRQTTDTDRQTDNRQTHTETDRQTHTERQTDRQTDWPATKPHSSYTHLTAIFHDHPRKLAPECHHDGSGGDNWSHKMCKAPVKSLPPTNQHPALYRPDVLHVTNSVKALKGIKNYHIPRTCSPSSPGIFHHCPDH